MSRNVFISVLGAGLYGACKYNYNKCVSVETRFVQTATLEHINAKEWSNTDVAVFLLTEGARRSNWEKTITSRKNWSGKEEPYESLLSVLEKMELPIQIKDLPIPDGKNEDETWKIFDILYNFLEDGDNVYFDLTHSFRYLPMLVLVFSNYAKFLKNISVKHISYGNYEMKDQNTNVAPIINLLPLSALQDWTFAAATYIENGNIERLVNLSNEILKPILRNPEERTADIQTLDKIIDKLQGVVEEWRSCRGKEIHTSKNLAIVKKLMDKLDITIIPPLNPVFLKIKDTLDKFDSRENIKNGFEAAKWCFHNGLYQQSVTIMLENIVTFFCIRHNIEEYTDRKLRGYVNSAFNICMRETNGINSKKETKSDEGTEIIEELLKDELFQNKDLINAFSNLTGIRNDINHAGMRTNGRNPKKIKEEISKYLDIYSMLTP